MIYIINIGTILEIKDKFCDLPAGTYIVDQIIKTGSLGEPDDIEYGLEDANSSHRDYYINESEIKKGIAKGLIEIHGECEKYLEVTYKNLTDKKDDSDVFCVIPGTTIDKNYINKRLDAGYYGITENPDGTYTILNNSFEIIKVTQIDIKTREGVDITKCIENGTI